MKLVYLINNTWYAGGQTRVLANKVNYWVEHGHEVYILTTDQLGRQPFYEIDPRVKMIDFDIRYIQADQLSKWEKIKLNPTFLRHHWRLLKKTLSEIRPDITISMFGKDMYLLPFIKDGSAKILEAHGARYTWIFSRKGLLGKLHNWVDLQIVKRFDRLVTLTHEDLPTWGVNNAICITNASSFEPTEVANLDVHKVIASGRYSEQKNFESLIEAWVIVHSLHPEWILKLCGQGLENLDHMIDALGLGDSIEKYESKNMLKEYMDSSICACSSKHEGLSMILVESHMCGIPGVSYACPCGPRDIIVDGETGFLIEQVGDHISLAKSIVRLIEDEDTRKTMGRNARERAIRLFSVEVIMNQWIRLFKELTETAKR
ncbi:glycosyltransferase family 4 protein [uncultured Porphyromonas sp.]|uniref:glycosyltransferase family 4 protein n=1 Tax=uncultured Porphyromonas sp. TaxID=159274 RepID=UPI002629DE33|nr:glycosyltransferase family 4 protein [uncultured Porphyromonas sp.]